MSEDVDLALISSICRILHQQFGAQSIQMMHLLLHPSSMHDHTCRHANPRVSPWSPMVLCEEHRQHSRLGGFGFHPRQAQRRDARRPSGDILAAELSHCKLRATAPLCPVQMVAPRRRPSLQLNKIAHACVARCHKLLQSCAPSRGRPASPARLDQQKAPSHIAPARHFVPKLARNFLQTSTRLAR